MSRRDSQPTQGHWRRRLFACAAALLLVHPSGVCAAPPQSVPGAGWPSLRGPDYDAVAPDEKLADAWPDEGPPVLWFRELGQGYSAFVVADERAYTQYQTLYGQCLVCLNADTGETIWQHRYGLAYHPASIYPGPRSTPAIVEDRVYWVSPNGVVGCVSSKNGHSLWSVDLEERFGLRGVGFGYSASPVIEDEKVILPIGAENASVVALDARDGATVWASGNSPASYCSILPIVFQGRRLLVAFLENELACFDLKSGAVEWRWTFSAGYDEHAAAPLYKEPLLMVAVPFRAGATLFRFDPPKANGTGKINVSQVWGSLKLSNDVASSILIDGFLYGFDLRDPQSKAHRPSRGEFRCLKLQTGEVMWSTDRTGHASVIAGDGKLILFNDQGEVLLVRQNPAEYEELGRIPVFGDEICWTSPALTNGRLYLRTQQRAACLYLGLPEALTEKRKQRSQVVADVTRPRRLDPTLLLGGEREHPFVRPDFAELTLWYCACLIAIGSAGTLAALTFCVMRKGARRQSVVHYLFWLAMLVCGLVATPIGNALQPEFILTWPVSLFAGFELTLLGIVRAESQSDRRKARRISRLTGLAFLALCLTYFLLCRRLSLAHEAVFLLGFLPAWPAAVFAARRIVRQPQFLIEFVLGTLAFTIYFWGSGGVLLLKSLMDD